MKDDDDDDDDESNGMKKHPQKEYTENKNILNVRRKVKQTIIKSISVSLWCVSQFSVSFIFLFLLSNVNR